MLSVNLGPLSLPASYVLLLLAFIVALIVGLLVGRRDDRPIAGTIADIFLVAMISARIGFVLMYFEHYQDDLWGIIDIRDGGFDVLSGVTGAFVLSVYLLWRRPANRRALGFAVASGFMTWGAITATVNLIETQANKVPDEPFANLDGASTTLGQISPGKPMVVNLWASWCPPCIREMPVLAAAQKQHPDIAFIFVNQGEDAETIRQFMAHNDLELNNTLTDTAGNLGRITGSHGLPTTLFYDANGRQVDAHMGELSKATLARSLSHFSSD
ncbi:prolipoprotein diacylglyceryl transferase family protein [Marinobacter sp. 1Y8]